MATDRIELRMVLRDEVTKAVNEIAGSMRKLDRDVSTRRSRSEIEGLSAAAKLAGREITAAFQAIGVTGGVIGGGLVASVVGMTRALTDFSRNRLQLHYMAQELGTTTELLEKFTDAGQTVGLSQEQAAQGIQSAARALQDLRVHGSLSSVWQAIAPGKGGVELLMQWRQALNSPEGLEGTLRLIGEQMSRMGSEAQASIARALGIGTVALREMVEVFPRLRQRIQPLPGQLRDFMIANVNLNSALSDLKTTIGVALTPAFTALQQRIDAFLGSPQGEEFRKKIEEWGKSLERWITSGEADKFFEDFFGGAKEVFDDVRTAFTAADKMIKAIDLTWPQVIGGLIVLEFAKWLGGVAVALGLIAPHRSLLALIVRAAPAIGAVGALTWWAYKVKQANEQKIAEQRETKVPTEGLPDITLGDVRRRVAGERSTIWDLFRERGGGSILRGLLNPYGTPPLQKYPSLFGQGEVKSHLGEGQAYQFTDMLAGGGDQIRFKPDMAWAEQLSGGYSTNIEDRRTREDLTDDFKDLRDQVERLNDFMRLNKGEGGPGTGPGGAITTGDVSNAVYGPGGSEAAWGKMPFGGVGKGGTGPGGAVTGEDVQRGVYGPGGREAAWKEAAGGQIPAGGAAGEATYQKMLSAFQGSSVIGKVPTEAQRFGFTTGSAEEWARFGTAVAKAESGFNPRSRNLNDPGGSFGILQYAHGQVPGRNAYNVDASVAAFVRDAETSMKTGSLRRGLLGRRFSTIGAHPERTARNLRTYGRAQTPGAIAAETQPAPTGSADVNVDVRARKTDSTNRAALFRKHKIERAPQMNNTGGDSVDWSNFNYE